MKSRKSGFGLLLLFLAFALTAYVWSQYGDKRVDPDYGLLDMIKSVGDGIAQRLGRG